MFPPLLKGQLPDFCFPRDPITEATTSGRTHHNPHKTNTGWTRTKRSREFRTTVVNNRPLNAVRSSCACRFRVGLWSGRRGSLHHRRTVSGFRTLRAVPTVSSINSDEVDTSWFVRRSAYDSESLRFRGMFRK